MRRHRRKAPAAVVAVVPPRELLTFDPGDWAAAETPSPWAETGGLSAATRFDAWTKARGSWAAEHGWPTDDRVQEQFRAKSVYLFGVDPWAKRPRDHTGEHSRDSGARRVGRGIYPGPPLSEVPWLGQGDDE